MIDPYEPPAVPQPLHVGRGEREVHQHDLLVGRDPVPGHRLANLQRLEREGGAQRPAHDRRRAAAIRVVVVQTEGRAGRIEKVFHLLIGPGGATNDNNSRASLRLQ